MAAEPGRERGVEALLDAIATHDDARVTSLLACGVDVNARGADGETPLVTAAASGDLTILEHLLAADADANLPDEEGNVPLSYALMSKDPAPALALLRAGARADAPSELLATAAAHAPASTVEALLERGAAPNSADSEQRTPLLAACAAARLDTARLLLARGADARARDQDGTTTLLALLEGASRASLLPDVAALRSHASGSIEGFRPIVAEAVARSRGTDGVAHQIELPEGFPEVLDALLEGGARVDAVDEIGRNALAIAVCDGYPEWVIEKLLRHGGDPHRTDDDGLSALDFAELHPSAGVRALLER